MLSPVTILPKTVSFSRDRLGLDPVYYRFDGENIWYATNAAALRMRGDTRNPEWDADYRAFQVGLDGRTPWNEIHELMPGHRLIDGRPERYWRLSFGEYEPRDPVGDIRDLIRQAVENRVEDDSAAMLSGGVDSSVVASLARVPAFHGHIRDFDESRYAIEAAASAGLPLTLVEIDGTFFDEVMPEVIEFLGFPVAGPGSYSQYKVCAAIFANGFTSVISGSGGDEVFVGYARTAAAFGDPVPTNYEPLMDTLRGISSVKARYRRAVTRSEGREDWFEDRWDDEHPLDAMQRFDIEVLLPGLLQVEAQTSAAFGLKPLAPLLDHRLVEYVCSLAPHLRYDGTLKNLLKKAARDIVPLSVLFRNDKMGFPTPWHQWTGDGSGTRAEWGEWCMGHWESSWQKAR